jgi:hypothetical protein
VLGKRPVYNKQKLEEIAGSGLTITVHMESLFLFDITFRDDFAIIEVSGGIATKPLSIAIMR